MKDQTYYVEKLKTELASLKDEIKTVGVANPDNPGDWEPKPENIDVMDSDLNESADRIEARQETQAILDTLEASYQNVTRALKKLEDGTYGTCEICGEMIEEDRLDANPSARTCKKHMEEESTLSL